MNDDNRISAAPADVIGEHAESRWHRLFAGRRVLLVVVVLVVLALLAWLLTPKGTRAPAGRFGAGGPMPVVGAPAKSGDMPIVLNGLGAVTPIATVTVQSQISGQITQISFKEGQTVKPGDPLIQIDPRPYQVALEQAEGALVRDKALLGNANVDLARYVTLFKEDSVAEQTLATQRSLVVQDEGNVKTDQGQIDASVLQNNLVGLNVAWDVTDKFRAILDADQSTSKLNPNGQLSSIDADVGYGPSGPGGSCLAGWWISPAHALRGAARSSKSRNRRRASCCSGDTFACSFVQRRRRRSRQPPAPLRV